mgnify:CR=1 FL=1
MGKLKSLGSKLLAGPYLIWMLLFTVVPLCLIIYNAFTNSDGKFTFKYVSAIAAPVNFKPLLLSFQMSLIVTIVCLLLAFPLAVILSKYSTDKNSFIVMIFMLYSIGCIAFFIGRNGRNKPIIIPYNRIIQVF